MEHRSRDYLRAYSTLFAFVLFYNAWNAGISCKLICYLVDITANDLVNSQLYVTDGIRLKKS